MTQEFHPIIPGESPKDPVGIDRNHATFVSALARDRVDLVYRFSQNGVGEFTVNVLPSRASQFPVA
jgi:hypothetical protein